MKAILIRQTGGPENLTVAAYEKPSPKAGLVLIKVKAFGINRAELYMRKGEWGETTDIIGIECVGIVEADPSGEFKPGQKVAAICGGMSRTVNGSYAEYTNVPKTNVIALETNLPWNELAAIPETYATAWALLNWGLSAKPKETILVRGGSSTLGQACIILANQSGMRVIATTRHESKSALLQRLGAERVIIDNGQIHSQVLDAATGGVDHVIELIGASTLLDSFGSVKPMGSVCLAGFLGGLKPFDNFQPLMQIPSGLRFSVFGSAFVFGEKGFEVAKIPLQEIITDIEEQRIPNIYKTSFPFEAIGKAHKLVETNDINGKVVVEL
jgi:NADPH2:quinone reductase